MKKPLNWILSMGIMISFSSCFNPPGDGSFNPGDLPDGVIEFISENYAGYRLDDIHTEDICNDSILIKVELEDGPSQDVDLYFSLEGTFLFAAIEVSENDLPEAVRSAIATTFSGYSIDNDDDDAVMRFEFPDGSFQYEVELERTSGSDLEVIFDAAGNILCQDDRRSDDDDGNDDNGGNGSDDDNGGDDNGGNNGGDDNGGNNGGNGLSESISNYVRTNYPGYHIDDSHNEDLCDRSIVLKVELEDGPGPDIDLYFTLEGIFLFAAKEISPSDLPGAVRTAIATQFPGYELEDDNTERYEFPDGSRQYKVELERASGSGSDIEVIFDTNGNVVCKKD